VVSAFQWSSIGSAFVCLAPLPLVLSNTTKNTHFTDPCSIESHRPTTSPDIGHANDGAFDPVARRHVADEVEQHDHRIAKRPFHELAHVLEIVCKGTSETRGSHTHPTAAAVAKIAVPSKWHAKFRAHQKCGIPTQCTALSALQPPISPTRFDVSPTENLVQT
jgi:hypothetical protein